MLMYSRHQSVTIYLSLLLSIYRKGLCMGERLNISNSNAESKEVEQIDKYDSAVAETLAEYENKTPFEQKVMRDIVINERITKECISFEERLLGRNRTFSSERIKEEFEYDFNFNMNCGGFALEIFCCLFTYTKSLDGAVKKILETFPFVRLEDNETLAPDEYRVFYRHQEEGFSHHFVKEENGKLLEKDGSSPVQDFKEWPDSLKDAPEAVFIVNKNHDIQMVDEDGFRQWSISI